MSRIDYQRMDFGALADWIEGRMDRETSAQVTAAVESNDPILFRRLSWLHKFLDTAEAMPLISPPLIVRQKLRQHFARWSGAQPRPEASRPIYQARLIYDSRSDRTLESVRGPWIDDETIHLAFGSGVADLVIDAHPLDQNRFAVKGQVLLAEPSSSPIFEAAVTCENVTTRTLAGDQFGRFELVGVPAGTAEFWATNGEVMIEATVELTTAGYGGP